MKLELNREELKKAVELYVNDKGINTENSDIDIKLSRNVTIVTIKEKEAHYPEPPSLEPFTKPNDEE